MINFMMCNFTTHTKKYIHTHTHTKPLQHFLTQDMPSGSIIINVECFFDVSLYF